MGKRAAEAFAFIEGASMVRKMRHLERLLLASIEPYGFSGCIIGQLTRPARGAHFATALFGWPHDWYRRYLSEGYVKRDPVARHLKATSEPFLWSEVDWDPDRDPEGRRIMEEAREFGLEDGFVVPIPGIDWELNGVSMAGRPRPLDPSDRQILQLISIYAHHRARFLARGERPPAWAGPAGAMPLLPAQQPHPAARNGEGYMPHGLRTGAVARPDRLACRRPVLHPARRGAQRGIVAYESARWPPEIEVHAVTIENRHLYQPELSQCSRLFAMPGVGCSLLLSLPRQLGPADPAVAAVHLLAVECETGQVKGAIRLVPSLRRIEPRLRIGDHARIERPIPRDPNVFEWTGYRLARSSCEGRTSGSVAAILTAGLQEYCIKENIEQLLTVVGAHSLGILLDLGWNPDPLGLPRAAGSSFPTPILLDISEHALTRTRMLLDVPGPVVRRRSIRHPQAPRNSARRLH